MYLSSGLIYRLEILRRSNLEKERLCRDFVPRVVASIMPAVER